MKKGIQILIITLVAIATNIGLRAAFWNNCGNWSNQHPHHKYWNNTGCENNNGNCANPWGCHSYTATPADSIK
jgi:hypothetical protein